MLLTDLQTKVGIVAERAIPSAALLMAATEVVNDIERRHSALVTTSTETVALDGTGLVTLTLARRSTSFAVRYVPPYPLVDGATETGELLVENGGMALPTADSSTRIMYYQFVADDQLQLSALAASGSITVSYRTHGQPLTMTVPGPVPPATIPVDVPHAALFMGTLAWFGRNIWLDQRTDGWTKSYEEAIKGELSLALRRTSTLGNLGARN